MGAYLTDIGVSVPADAEPIGTRLICFPHSGGSSFAFRGLASALPGTHVLGVTLPGRSYRFAERPDISWDEFTDALAAEIARLSPKPFALVGHSLGALVAYEVACRLVDLGGPLPAFVGVSACPPPSAYDRDRAGRVAGLPDHELLELMATWGGLAAQDVHRPEMGRMVPGIRADFALGAGYRPRSDRAPLPMPLLVWGSRDDELVDYASLAGWEARTTAGAPCAETSGGHYYLASESGSMAARIARQFELDHTTLVTLPTE